MTGITALTGLLGIATGLGIITIAAGLRHRPATTRRESRPRLTPRERRRLYAAIGAGTTAALLTRWPAAALLTGAAIWWLPPMIGANRAQADAIARIEAVAGWAESLRDTLTAASGLEQAIQATTPLAPAVIAAPLADLSDRLRAGQPAATALRHCGDALADPTADLVIVALITAAEGHARDLAGLLGALAHAARDQAAMRLRVSTARARIRSATRIIIAATAVMAGALVLWARAFLAPYDSPTGQIVLLAIGAVIATAIAWLHHQTRFTTPARILTSAASGGEQQP